MAGGPDVNKRRKNEEIRSVTAPVHRGSQRTWSERISFQIGIVWARSWRQYAADRHAPSLRISRVRRHDESETDCGMANVAAVHARESCRRDGYWRNPNGIYLDHDAGHLVRQYRRNTPHGAPAK